LTFHLAETKKSTVSSCHIFVTDMTFFVNATIGVVSRYIHPMQWHIFVIQKSTCLGHALALEYVINFFIGLSLVIV